MELQKKIRMQMMMIMVGLGAALLMAGSARAQQDMNPTSFDVNPGTPAVSKAAVVRMAHNSPVAKENAQAESMLAQATSKDATLEANVTRMAILDASIVLILLGGVFSIVLYAMNATRRERMVRVSPVSAPYHTVSAATAQ
jgi:hypothetical protein